MVEDNEEYLIDNEDIQDQLDADFDPEDLARNQKNDPAHSYAT